MTHMSDLPTEVLFPSNTQPESQTFLSSKNDALTILKHHFPNCFDKHGVFLADKIAEVLQQNGIAAKKEGYSLNWLGKSYAKVLKDTQPETLLAEDIAHNRLPENQHSENVLIQGDNLEVLKHLKHAYKGAIKMIYIDPPYNTGSDGFVYQDDRKFTPKQLMELGGMDLEEAERVLAFTAKKSNSHSAWLTFMYPRLYIARELLRDDGVIFISIDDNEQAQLKILCDEVFGEENCLVNTYIQVRYADKTLAEKNDFQKLIEQVLIYQKTSEYRPIKEVEEYKLDKFCWSIIEKNKGKRIEIGGKQVDIFYPDEYEIIKKPFSIQLLKETWATGTVLKANASGKFFGTHLSHRKEIDGLGVLYKVYGIGEDGLGYRYFTGAKKENATKGKFYSGVPNNRKDELAKGSSLKEKPILNFYDFADAFGNCRHEGNVDFRNGKKPLAFVMQWIKQSVLTNKNDLILDFFAGSGTTAHAVMQLNAEDQGNRRYICVQLPEATDKQSEAYKAGYQTIFDITKARIEKAAVKIQAENPDYSGDLGFKIFKTEPNFGFAETYGFQAALNDNFELAQSDLPTMKNSALSDEQLHTLLTTWRVYDGCRLPEKVETIDLAGYPAYYCRQHLYLLASGFHSGSVKALIERLDDDQDFVPERIVLFGNNMDSAMQKELAQAVKTYANKKGLNNLSVLARY